MNREQAMQLINAYMAGYGTIAKPQAVTFAPRDVTIHNEEAESMEQKHNVCTRLTTEEREALTKALKTAGVKNQSEAVRMAIAAWCKAQGVEFPHTPRNWGAG